MKTEHFWLIIAGAGAFAGGWMLADAFPHSPVLLFVAGLAALVAYAALLMLAARVETPAKLSSQIETTVLNVAVPEGAESMSVVMTRKPGNPPPSPM